MIAGGRTGREGRVDARGEDAGFTLVEAVVALGVFSIAVLALLRATGEQARSFARIEQASMARFVADNIMAEAMVDPTARQRGVANGEVILADQDWTWTRTVIPTDDPAILRVDVAVRLEGATLVLAEATAFRRAPRTTEAVATP